MKVSSAYNLSAYLDNKFIVDFIQKANGNYNVLGPMTLSNHNLVSYGNLPKYQFLFFADDSSKNLDIKAIYLDSTGKTVRKTPIAYLNTKFDEAYPFINNQGNSITFCSNREGNFDIFEAKITDYESLRNAQPSKIPIIKQLISPEKVTVSKISAVSSVADDKCPYYWNNVLVFASNRAGGYGGYDIYYSVYKNGEWSTPINAGSRINTPYDEYRPIIPFTTNFTYPLMIFSSNRPNGKGGFDLYMTGLAETNNMMEIK